MAEFQTVTKADDLEDGDMKAFEVGGVLIAIARIGDTFHAFDDTCTHEQCSLSDGGDLEGIIVVCPCHSSEFDVTNGDVVAPPADTPIRVYEIRLQGDDLQVKV